jgi:DegV family protein with EDD domain
MSKVAIITDSTSYIPPELCEKYQVNVAPQILIWGEETFRDGIDIMPEAFYTRLKKASTMPSTSQVTIPYFHTLFEKLLGEGRDILAILVSNKLSGTIDSAIQARQMLPNSPIEIVDSLNTAMALGFQVLLVAKAAQDGANLAECKALAEKAASHTGVCFAVDTLEFLHRGGRIGGGSRFIGTVLNFKPILEVVNGRVEAVERVRTRKKSISRLVEITQERIGERKPVRLSVIHANAPEEAEALRQELREKISADEYLLAPVSPVVGTHAGPGTVGVSYIAGI